MNDSWPLYCCTSRSNTTRSLKFSASYQFLVLVTKMQLSKTVSPILSNIWEGEHCFGIHQSLYGIVSSYNKHIYVSAHSPSRQVPHEATVTISFQSKFLCLTYFLYFILAFWKRVEHIFVDRQHDQACLTRLVKVGDVCVQVSPEIWSKAGLDYCYEKASQQEPGRPSTILKIGTSAGKVYMWNLVKDCCSHGVIALESVVSSCL